jgi:nucleoside-diphosphate-sugar epimerase
MQTIIGAGGTIGNPLARELKNYADKIRLVSRNPQQINGTDELLSADATDAAALDKAVEGSEIVYCTIGFNYSVKAWRETWPPFIRNLTESCLKHNAKLVFFDNVYMYSPDSISHMTESSPIGPVSKKGKIRNEVAKIIEAAGARGLNWIIARSADFYGPDNRQSVLIETVWKNIKSGKKAQWLGDASKIHTYTYTPDAAKATALLGNTADAYNQVWHLPTSKEKVTGKDWVKLFAEASGGKPGVQVAAPWLVKVMSWFMPVMAEIHEMLYQNTQDYVFLSDKFEERFPDFKITEPAEGVSEIVRSETT